MRYFGIEKVSRLIQRLKGEPNLRLLCGFAKVPGKAAFSRMFAFLSGQEGLLEKPLEGIVAVAHKAPEKDKGTEKDRGLAVYHVNRDSTAIPAREKVMKKPREKAPEAGKTAQKQPETPERTDGHRKA
ncbi:MAG: hypothetical protein LBT00_14455, partial [Spirochaetaceae bacterium]|nr:hypothetical protein [Spirochaetaceae bacterium]